VLLTYDVIGLAAHLTNLVTDKKRYEILIARRGADAQSLLDLLQAVCSYLTTLLDVIDVRSLPAFGLPHRIWAET
jgi:hypothetical protein